MRPRLSSELRSAARALRRAGALAALAGVLAASAGCSAIKPVQPWEKGALAKPEMLIEGDPLEARFNEHIYTSKEGASGGSGVGGGGCGCN
ncbi:DUF4266 domain-containing protein [Massilia sp. Root418]|uniref:DUF4266 domain-containing protein n=1 Tax=Massilia sp. Root418 TaxID=1736532 RepID=UPI0009E7C0DE|nr:DUF4266 domain-containing protein [Massilia sp. Root418]